MRTAIKRSVMWLFLRGLVPARAVVAIFHTLRLRSL
jgi:hypothetical protein